MPFFGTGKLETKIIVEKRKEMRKKANPAFLIIGIIFISISVFVFIRNGQYLRVTKPTKLPQEVTLPSDNNINLPVVVRTSLKEDEKNWMNFGGIDLLSASVGFDFAPFCGEQSSVSIPPIKIIAWHPKVFETGEFGIGEKMAVAWEHLGYEGLLIHSGWDFWLEQSPATDLQYFLETDALNEVQNLETIENRLQNCLRGSSVHVSQDSLGLQGNVAAAVRIPPQGVEELSKHTMDLVPFLREAYPGAGFEDIDENALLLLFCGRAAVDEQNNPQADYWTQARYIIALMPAMNTTINITINP